MFLLIQSHINLHQIFMLYINLLLLIRIKILYYDVIYFIQFLIIICFNLTVSKSYSTNEGKGHK